MDRIWDAFWSGGISNPLEVMEQITYLLFIKRLDDLHTLEENRANRLGEPMARTVFLDGAARRHRPRWPPQRSSRPSRRCATTSRSPDARSAGGGERVKLRDGLDVDDAELAALCRRHGVIELSVFGSVLRDDFGPDSDVDVLVTFAPGVRPPWGGAALTLELEGLLGRKVDVGRRESLHWGRPAQGAGRGEGRVCRSVSRRSTSWTSSRRPRAIATFLVGRSAEEFTGDDLLASAVHSKLIIIGEAAARLPEGEPTSCGGCRLATRSSGSGTSSSTPTSSSISSRCSLWPPRSAGAGGGRAGASPQPRPSCRPGSGLEDRGKGRS